jgi:hypothetical protein
MSVQHRDLAAGRWFTFSLIEQMANIGSEVERAILWRERGNSDYALKAVERALELLDLTIADARHRRRLRELTRVREVLADDFYAANQYGSSGKLWHSYFYPFACAARARAARQVRP